jgi:hypothetical protein
MRLAVLAHQVIDGTADDRLLSHAAPHRSGPSHPAQGRPAQARPAQGRPEQGRSAQGRPVSALTRTASSRGSAWGRSATGSPPPGRPQSPRPTRLADQPGARPIPEPWRTRPEQRRPPQGPGPAESAPRPPSDQERS